MMRSPIATRKSLRIPSSDSAVHCRDQETSKRPECPEVTETDNSVDVSGTLKPSTGAHGDVSSPSGGETTALTSGQGRIGAQKLDGNAFSSCSPSSSEAGSEASYCRGGPGKVCGEPVLGSDKGVECDRCGQWYHTGCLGISNAAYDALNKYHKVFSWFCPPCKKLLKVYVPDSMAIKSKIDELATTVDNRMKLIELSLREQEQAVDHQTKLIERSIKESHVQKASYADMVKGSCSDVVAKVTAKVASIPQSLTSRAESKDMQNISKVFDDFLEKDKRKNNLVIHNLPESEGDTFAERADKDTRLFQDVVKDTFRMNASVSKVYRVGKVMEGKPRLLIVTLATPGVKGDILRLAPQLRNSNAWGNIYITPDLTKAEREAARKVREELASRKAAGESNLTIRKGKVVPANRPADHGQTSKPNKGHLPHGEHQSVPLAGTSRQGRGDAPAVLGTGSKPIKGASTVPGTGGGPSSPAVHGKGTTPGQTPNTTVLNGGQNSQHGEGASAVPGTGCEPNTGASAVPGTGSKPFSPAV